MSWKPEERILKKAGGYWLVVSNITVMAKWRSLENKQDAAQ